MQIQTDLFNKINDPEKIAYYEKKYSIPKGIVSIILSQKIVNRIRSKYHVIIEKRTLILEEWLDGKNILSLAKKNEFSPVNLSSNILMELGCSKKAANWLLRNPEKIEDERLRNEIIEAVEKDIIFSPRAHSRQMERAYLGEIVIEGWLKQKNIVFLTEDQLTQQGNPKTPDFSISSGLMFQGKKIFWIDSKAVYGDMNEHKRHERNQYNFYNDMYGQGLVVYWYGYDAGIEKVSSVETIDGEFFKENYPEEYKKMIELGEFIS